MPYWGAQRMVAQRVHCAECGAEDPDRAEGLTVCCQAPRCGGVARQRWEVAGEPFVACCAAFARRAAAGRGIPRRVALW